MVERVCLSNTIVLKVTKSLLVLGSDREGEVVSAARALTRLLASVGLDLHDLALVVAAPVPARRGPEPSQARYLPLEQIVSWILSYDDGSLNGRERAFVEDMDALIKRRRPTEPQEAWLRALFLKLRRRRP